jgi:polysaccharide biosynthesis protein PslF
MSTGLKIIFISSYIPRECGIATYTNNLIKAIKSADPNVRASVIAMNDDKYNYPKEVIASISQNNDGDYLKAAELINNSDCDVVSVQHEFGIYGGFNGNKLLFLLKHLKKPVVITLHTVSINLDEPVRIRAKRYKSRNKLSGKMFAYVDGISVMTETAKSYLEKNVKNSLNKTYVVPHGAERVSSVQIEKDQKKKETLGFKKNDFVISTFGLITPKKGLEYMIMALPEIIKNNPKLSIKYAILGKTHPKKSRKYMHYLVKLSKKLKLENNVFFYPYYLKFDAIYRDLANTNIYITPYYSKEQASSGTLSYAIEAGKCIVSTPYVFAQDVVKNYKVGELVKFKDSKSISLAINKLIQNPDLIKKYSANAKVLGRQIEWPKIGQKFIDLFSKSIRGKYEDRNNR